MTGSGSGGPEDGDDPTSQNKNRSLIVQRQYDPDRDSGLAAAVVFAIADAEDIAPSEVKSPPLYETVDIAGIEQAFFSPDTDESARRGMGTFEFHYTKFHIKIKSDGWIHVYEPTKQV